MRCLLVTNRGCEDIAAEEIKEIIGADSYTREYTVSFEAGMQELLRLYYRSQTASRILIILQEMEFKSLEDIEKNLDFKHHELFRKSAAVRCKRFGAHDFSSNDAERAVGGYIHDRLGLRIDLEDPETLFMLYIIEDMAYIGIDLAKMDLSKRTYHVFNAPGSIKGTLAYCMVRAAGYKGRGTIADPFSRTGDILLEAAHMATGRSIHFFQKDRFDDRFARVIEEEDAKICEIEGKIVGYDHQLRFIKAAQKNARIAGVHKDVSFVRGDISWLDTKFKEGEVDAVATKPPQASRIHTEKGIVKIAKELFYHLDFILKSGKSVVLLCRDPTIYARAAKEFRFRHFTERPVWQGKEQLFMLAMQKA